ncbi:MAG TPA: aminodeoxychorismate/anthranilate synthase component II [Candidatus Dormibacteraeota bacterium]|jgi:anthranilate synthase/aminodeoxychorismate synthase-like glutamine amidotransferase|nr:aminodeoxychorismate/anthranilate synthase component II [Candidatus Dormibacteraeota bacterium]
MSIAMIDNYDSFTYNLVQYMAELGAEPQVFRNDEVTVEELAKFDGIVISPGPGTPDDAGVSNDAIRELSGRVAILGVCLGHQCIGQVFGGEVVRNEPSHGKTAWIHHDNSGVLAGVSEPFEATRYHSLIVKRSSVPPDLVVTAWTHEGVVMGLRHVRYPTYGVQFHPESVLTREGKKILGNFIRRASKPSSPLGGEVAAQRSEGP